MSAQELEFKTKAELVALAKAKNIQVKSSWLKQRIIDAILAVKPVKEAPKATGRRSPEY